jgi:hypothetical protein
VAVAPFLLLQDRNQVRLHHFLDQRVKARLVAPAQRAARLARIAQQGRHLGGTEVARVDLDQQLPGRFVDTPLVRAVAASLDRPGDLGEGLLDEFPHRMAFTGRT